MKFIGILSVMTLLLAAGPVAAYELGDTAGDFTLPRLFEGDGSLYDHQLFWLHPCRRLFDDRFVQPYQWRGLLPG